MKNAMQMTDAELAFAVRDLSEVIANQERMARNGLRTPKLGAYWDEFFALDAETKRRAAAGKVAA